MRILILGAGGIGGYFGVRLHEAGGDVSFLVRPARAELLKSSGLRLSSPLGDARITPCVLTTIRPQDKYDVILLACKAYDLASAMEAIAPAIGASSIVVPLLNGLAHLEALDRQFGNDKVQGGLAHLAVTLTSTGEIMHLNQLNRLVIGPRSTTNESLLQDLLKLLTHTPIAIQLSSDIEQDMWDKFVFLSVLAAATCTMRASVGTILATNAGAEFISGLLEEAINVASSHQRSPKPDTLNAYRAQLRDPGSTLTSSMLRDVERGGQTEADHVLGDMISRGVAKGLKSPLLKLAYSHLQAYELRRS
ncbi:MAG: 2-dehydropantoate 2-reductase [Acidiferrobacteraceae bacterium]